VNRRQVYEFIAAEKTAYPVRLLCRLLGVGHSAFYQWQRAGRTRVAERQRHDQHRAEIARQAWADHRQVYGARRLTTELHERGHRWNRKAVARLMRLAGIEGAHRRRRGRSRPPIRIDSDGPGPLRYGGRLYRRGGAAAAFRTAGRRVPAPATLPYAR